MINQIVYCKLKIESGYLSRLTPRQRLMQTIADNQVGIQLSAKIFIASATAIDFVFTPFGNNAHNIYTIWIRHFSLMCHLLFVSYCIALHKVEATLSSSSSSLSTLPPSSQWNATATEKKVKCNHINSNNFSSNGNYLQSKGKKSNH